ncbi:hypothetical protein F8M41_022614 [Gigaspora margarita]|uniref:Serine protease n=1 Tax=Gigaspora margarita TaxID=4874 RepID=A0A8H4AEU5_GIGMA|nr:hypothetical protein F8M41_022614 [Gigaspora margarita]
MSVDFLYLLWNSDEPQCLIGRVSKYSTGTMGYDKGYILKENNIFNASPIIRNSDDPDFPELPIVGYLPLFTIGASLFKSGYTIHVTCGILNSFLEIQRFVEDGITYTKFNVWEANLVSRKGDSSGPVFKFVLGEEGVRIVGMVISVHDANNKTAFHPTNVILQRDDGSLMDLITEP